MAEKIISTNYINNIMWNPIESLERRQEAFKLREKNKIIHPYKYLSSQYLTDAKKLGYTWNDLINKKTREKVIDKVIKSRMTNIINEAKKSQTDAAITDAKLQRMEEKVKKDHENIMKKQPKTTIKQVAKAVKGYTESFEIGIINNKDPLSQLQNTRNAIRNHINNMLISMKGLKFVETLRVTFKKSTNNEIMYKTAYFNSKPQTIINNTEINEALQLSKQQILNITAQWISEGSGWTVESVDNHYLNTVKYEPMKGSSYIKLPEELRHHRKGLINMKNEDNECFRWCHIRHLNPQDKNPQRIKKSDKDYINKLDYSGIDFPVNIKQYNTIENKNEININVFGYENKQPYPVYVSKEKYENQMNLY